MFRYLEPLFIGLIELKKHKIIHQDLSLQNIIFKNNQCYMIDFGLSCKYSNTKAIKERSRKQMTGSRIYDPYPYDYVYLYGTKKELRSELNMLQRKIYRENHEDYIRIHKDIFNRNNIDELIRNNLLYKST